MSASERLAAAWNSRDPAVVTANYAEDGVRHQFAHEEARLEGREAILAMITAIMHAVPDCSLEVRSIVGAEDTQALEWIFRGTVQNDFGTIPGNGQAVELNGSSVLSMTGDGLIQEEHVYWDTAHFLVGAGMI